MESKTYIQSADLNPTVIYSIVTPMQWLFFICFFCFFYNFFAHKQFIDLITAVFFLRWSITAYQLITVYEKDIAHEYYEAIGKEQRFYREIGRRGRRKLGVKQIK
jgi:hypothetical protein